MAFGPRFFRLRFEANNLDDEQIQIVPMHPNTLIKKVNKILTKIGHSSHDFRRTFITNAYRKFHWKDVQQAAGHTTHQMTMKYDQDDRQFSTDLADLGD